MNNIIFEDNHILVVDKAINIPTQADNSNDLDLLTILKKYLKEKYHKPGNVYLGLIHRLDRPVSGLMVFAKTSKAASRLSKQIRDHDFKKEYYAVVVGLPKEKDTLRDKLLKDTSKNITKVSEEGKEAILDYELVATKDNLSLVRINLLTGRSHQIRVQFSSRGIPLYGDHKYNTNINNNEQLALFAKKVSFTHPISKQVLTFELDLPERYPFNFFK